MSNFEITLRAGIVALETRNVREVLHKLATETGLRFHVTDEGTIAMARELSPLDRRAFAIDFELVRRAWVLRTEASSAPLAAWLGSQLARLLHATVDAPSAVTLEHVHELLEAHEGPLLEDDDARTGRHEDDDVKRVLDLVRLGRLVLIEDAEPQLLELVRAHTKADLLYEALLESDFVEDLFLSQSEFVTALHGAEPTGASS